MVKLVDIDDTSLLQRRIGALPIVNQFLLRLGLEVLFDEYVPVDPRATLAPSASLLILVRNLVIERTPAYKITEWVAGRPEALLGLSLGESNTLNDDRIGRALDALFEADRASMLTKLMCSVIKTFQVSLDELHNDATTLSMQGDYSSATGDSSPAPRVRFGHAKERPDLAQLIYLLTVSADGNVPITYRLADGNTPEDPTHIATWQSCRELAGRTDFLYVSDAKLCNRDAMGHIDRHHGRFLTVMPATRAEVGEFRRFIAKNTPVWTEAARRPGRHRGDLDVVFFATPAPSPSVEGYRIVWIRSSEKEVFDAEARRRAIEHGRVALCELDEKLSGPRCRLKNEMSVKAAAEAAIERARASRWVQADITTETVVRHKQQKRGRPGSNTAYVRIEQQRYSVAAVIADDVVRDDACFDGCWPLVTNDTQMTEADLLAVYKRQPGVENRHHVLKGVVDFVPVYLKSNERIDAFAFLGYIAVLVHALIERELRRAMRDADLAELPLYPEDRACKGPTAARVIEIFEPLCAHELVETGEVLKRYDPELSKLHRHILDLLKVPATTYLTAQTTSL
ncbi:IS1634 family transposase [Ferrimicrobium sp.]|uniref:IS1634 family transposase n=1 Tax=Ferrimicrobium sp. TaxID=2926050 RepID=UPI002633615F|nr:IS1634 family transposase [Ferrimicrobium sp.]